jgi:drug/metabolite transporter (DMT)-like permease
MTLDAAAPAPPIRAVGAAPWVVWTALGIVYVGWGSTYVAIRVLVESVPPMLGAGARFTVAGLLLLAWVAATHGPRAIRVRPVELAAAALIGALLLAGGNGLVTIGEQHVPSGLAALLIASVPLWIVVMRALTGDPPPRPALGGVAIGFAGVAVLLLPAGRPGHATAAGLVTLLAAAVFWAAGSFLSGRVQLPALTLLATALEMLCGGAILVAGGLVTGETASLHLATVSTGAVWAFAFLVLGGSLVTFSAYVWLLQNAPIGRVATYAFVNPVVAVALGAVLLGEDLTVTVVAGALVIVASVALVVRQEAVRA